MKNACLVLLGLGALAFLCSVVAKLVPAHHLFGSLPVAWWRLAIAFTVFATALKVIGLEK